MPYTLVNLPNPVAFTIGNLTEGLSGAALAHLALAWPSGRLRSRFEVRVVIAEYAWTLVFTGVAHAVLESFFQRLQRQRARPTCCSSAMVPGRYGTRSTRPASPGSVVLTGIVLTLIVRHWRSARGWSRRVMTPLLWISVAVVAQPVVSDVADNLNLAISNSVFLDALPRWSLLAGPALVVSRHGAGAVGARCGRHRVVDLEPGASPARLRDALARALGDSTLQLAFRLPDGSGYLDTSGQAVEVARPGPGRAVTPVADADGAVLVHDAGLEHEPQLLRLTAAAASMALEHSRLQAEVQAQLEQVRASRARIVEAGDAERRRLERDLHDGAQQRLVTLSLALGMARDRAAGVDPELGSLIESAGKEAKEALTELRELARGIHPAVLTETGLAGAIQALAERSPVATTITAVPDGRFPAAIEATAYFVVSEALANVAKHARADGAQVTIRRRPGTARG